MNIKNVWAFLLAMTLVIGCGGEKSATQRTEPSKGDLEVVSTVRSPGASKELVKLKGPGIRGPLRVVLQFSQPMVGEERVGHAEENPPLSFSPDIEGDYHWEDKQSLVFVPNAGLPISTQYQAKVAAGTRSANGFQLPANHEFEFESVRLSLQANLRDRKSATVLLPMVTLRFNQKVPYERVLKYCQFVNGEKKQGLKFVVESDRSMADVEIQYESKEASKFFNVIPREPLSKDTDWQWQCSRELRGEEGNTGLSENEYIHFHTYGPLQFVRLTPNAKDVVPEEGLALKIAFNNPLKAPYKMSLEPKVAGFPERCHALGDPPGLSCSVNLKARTEYRLTIEADQIDDFEQSLGEKKVVEFATADAKPTLSMESGYYVSELIRPVLPIWVRNVSSLQTRVSKITPNNFHKIRPNIDWWERKPLKAKGVKFRKKKLDVQGPKNQWHQFEFDPASVVGAKAGPGMYYVEIRSDELTDYEYEEGGVQKTLVNFTDIGVVSKLSPSKGLVWTTRLSTGESLPHAKVSVRNSKGKVTWQGVTNAEGIAILPGESVLEGKKEEGEHNSLRLYVSDGEDWTMLNPASNGGLSPWNFNVEVDYSGGTESLRGFTHTDRGLYRPGETVHIKGLARVTRLGSSLAVPSNKKVALEIRDPRGNIMESAELTMSKFGGFWTDIKLPKDARLGDYSIVAELEQGSFTQRFSVEEYRPATFEVTGKASKKRLVRRGELSASIVAKYFYGAALRKAEVKMTVHSRPRTVRFPQHQGFEFYDERKERSYYSHSSSYSQSLVTEDVVALDEEGNASIDISVSPNDINSDADLLIRASVTAPSNEVINKNFTIPYFRSRRYFGIKSPGYFMGVKKLQKFEVIGVNPAGKIKDGPARVKVTKHNWNCVWETWGYRGSYQCNEKKTEVLNTVIEMKDGKPGTFEFTPDGGGDYWVVVEGATNDTHSAAAQELYAWGDGGGSWRSDDSQTFDILVDKKEYRAGDTATLILKTDLAKAKGIVTIERDGVIETRFIDVSSTMKHLEIPITAAYAPNVYVSVALVQGRMGKGQRGKPRMRMGLVNLPVRPEGNKLKVSVDTNRADYRPGKMVSATVKVTDIEGNPVSAEVAVTAADEGVLSLIGYKTPNPTPTFYSPWGIGVSTATQFSFIRDIPGPNVERPATGGDSGGPGSLRSRFMSTAVWKPGIVTNEEGIAHVEFKAPDNLTAFRVMAVAADEGYRFGSSDKRFTVSKPLQLHRILPRFLTQGDRLRGGVVVHNETGKAGTAVVRLLGNEHLKLKGKKQQSVSIPVGGRVPVLFELTALETGSATLEFSVEMNGESDRVQFKLPVHHPSPIEKMHVAHGATNQEKEIVFKLPPDALQSSAEVLISVDRSGLAGIEDGLRDLIGYPYGCLEQTTSKVIPMIAVRGLIKGLNMESLSGTKLDEFVEAGIGKIGKHQTVSGGFSLWPGGEPSAYYTAYALWGLYLAKEAGYRVDQGRIDEGLSYLSYQGKRADESRGYYDATGFAGNQAFALYVRTMLGAKDSQRVAEMQSDSWTLPIYGKAFLARALAADVGAKDPAVRALVKDLSERAIRADKTNELIKEPLEGSLYYYMSSSVRTTAIVLDTLVALDKKNKAIPGLVRLLMKKRRGARHINTQGNLYSLLALNNYAKTLSGKALKVQVDVGGSAVIAGSLKASKAMQMASFALKEKETKIVIRPEGKSKAHYNIEVRYRRRAEALKATSHGLALKREYLDEAGNAKNEFKVGDLVRVRLTLPIGKALSHLMVSDRLPAGFEALNSRLKTVGNVGLKESRSYWGGSREMRDERVDFSSEYVYRYRKFYVREYMIRAIAEGKFALPPSRAELMYEPGTNAQTKLEYIEVKAKK